MSANTYTRIEGNKPRNIVSTPCHRCGGSGIYTQFHGTCFRCGGHGVDPTYKAWGFPASWTDSDIIEWNEKKSQRNEKARISTQERRAARRDAAFNSYLDSLSDEDRESIQALLDRKWDDLNEFVNDVLGKLRRYGSISENQKSSIIEAQARDDGYAAQCAEENANTPNLVEGRYTIEGEVLTTKEQDSPYGTQLKQLVKMDNGTKVWGTVPNAIWDIDRGDRVRFDAKVTVSNDDRTFGFYSRPTKAEVLHRGEVA